MLSLPVSASIVKLVLFNKLIVSSALLPCKSARLLRSKLVPSLNVKVSILLVAFNQFFIVTLSLSSSNATPASFTATTRLALFGSSLIITSPLEISLKCNVSSPALSKTTSCPSPRLKI